LHQDAAGPDSSGGSSPGQTWVGICSLFPFLLLVFELDHTNAHCTKQQVISYSNHVVIYIF
jgi:hypothetical protein